MHSRTASHAGSWYTADKAELSQQLDTWLAAVPSSTTPIGTVSSQNGPVAIPTPGARAIIAPHAGYSYSGPAAAWAYKSIDWSKAERVFLLGPSHHYYLHGAATTSFDAYSTPLGPLRIDTELVEKLAKDLDLMHMSTLVDEAEHSLEMHLPYIYKMLSLHFSPSSMPPLVPIMVGSTSPSTERFLGARLAPYLRDPGNVFVISSDFCHWGSRFRYTYYLSPKEDGVAEEEEEEEEEGEDHRPIHLRSDTQVSRSRPIHESIALVDQESMDAVESGKHDVFLAQLERTGNTVCGRHPIGVFMAAVERAEVVDREGKGDAESGRGRFRFVRYERSSLVERVRDSSVSYCSAFAVL
ncbi:UPF0103-domain-containing protein [Westerdykella ornata]|uniref:UPF0103-domain-containing protein n=1 Tax=Westerdykella ornata TaxID=318751 RepID=A0A6A6JU56_WESOR|nr:UPF0103-domain-containing protein [Westerdykella ornata]KAF2279368.1 UPF0103-domain-containing protein [Westerdykella ornata]